VSVPPEQLVPQLAPLAGYTHAPDPSQSFAPHVPPVVQVFEQQCVPDPPGGPHNPLAHCAFIVHELPAAAPELDVLVLDVLVPDVLVPDVLVLDVDACPLEEDEPVTLVPVPLVPVEGPLAAPPLAASPVG
jgi:hypothetical protein